MNAPLAEAAFGVFNAACPFEIMKFDLLYEGELPSNGNPASKWVIRHQLHPQLVELWRTQERLWRLRNEAIIPQQATTSVIVGHFSLVPGSSMARTPLAHEVSLAAPIDCGGHRVTPLVRRSLSLACSLDILFLRKEDPRIVTKGGDIDNRIKTLLDGLRKPSLDDLSGGKPDFDPLYCLLEEDSLVANLSIKTGRLLRSKTASPSEVHLVIGVSIIILQVNTANISLLGD
jgi:hypothetical protein